MSKKTLLLLSCLFLIAIAGKPISSKPSKLSATETAPGESEILANPKLKANLETAETDAALWGPETRITNNTTIEYTSYSQQKNIVVDQAGRIHVVWHTTSPSYSIWYKRFNPGTGWSNDTIISSDVPYTYNRYPSIALDSTGNIHVVWASGTTTTVIYYVYYKMCVPSGTGNDAWAPSVMLSNALTTSVKYTPDVAATPNGNIHAVWNERSATPNSYYAAYREMIGGVWQAQINLDSSATSTYQKYYVNVAGSRDNNVHITWYSYDPLNTYYQIQYMARIGGVWGTRENVTTGLTANQYYPSIACNNITNEPHILWRATNPDVWYKICHTYRHLGVWQTVDTLVDIGVARDLYEPQICYGPRGKMHAVWRGYTNASPSYYQIGYAERDSAGTWGAAQQLTVSLNHKYEPSIMVNDSDHAYVVWRGYPSSQYDLWYIKGIPPYTNDMACTNIRVPGSGVAPNENFTPVVKIKNMGTNPQSNIPVTVRIDTSGIQVYNQTTTFAGPLNYNDTALVTMPTSFTVGTSKVAHRMTAFTNLATDQNRANDTTRLNFGVIYPPNTYFQFIWETPSLTTAGIYGITGVQDTLIWVSRGYVAPYQVLIFNINTMTVVDSFAQYYPTGSYGYRDMTYDPDSDVVYVGFENNKFHKINATTYALIDSFVITGSNLPGVVRALTFDGDSLICSGFSVPVVKFATNGTNCHQINPAIGSTYGLALDHTNLRMYSTNATTAPNHTYEFDLPSWIRVLDTVLPFYGGTHGGCETFRNDTFLLGIIQSPDNKVVCIRIIPLANDVGVASILAPSGVISAGAQTPQALIKNYGSQANSFDVMMTIEPDGYADTVTVTGLAGADTTTVSFASWTPGSGFYTVSCSTMLAVDENNSNDAQSAMAALADYIEQFEGQDGGFTPDPA
ncbi:MAG: hypothetical protein OEW70_06790, partial [candidate division WOR-3 bacterium]|nr:hypothetical protein [candidate division WOR-3 bacterium]